MKEGVEEEPNEQTEPEAGKLGNKPLINVKPSSHQPSKAELEETIHLAVSPEK